MERLTFTKLWEKPENAALTNIDGSHPPIACYTCGGSCGIKIMQYGEHDFRPDINHIMSIGEKRKSFSSLEEAVAYVNSEEYR